MATFGKNRDARWSFWSREKISRQDTRHVHHSRQIPDWVIAKQLKNAAVVEIDEKQDNEELISHSNGVVVINYKQMEKI